FIYLTGFQFIPMLRHFDGQIMLKLYPIQDHSESVVLFTSFEFY
ncbi:ABC transporter permease, partial [Listeria floridensis FSL S10-1187]